MKKTVFIFPGQGAQYIGMGKSFYDEFEICKKIYQKAYEVTGIDVAKLCFEENDKLHETKYTQIAIYTMEVAILSALNEVGVKADVVAGLSLGEYSAMYAAGLFSLEDSFKLVQKRGEYMQSVSLEDGAMTAVIGLSADTVEDICCEQGAGVSIANYNCPNQIVITGIKSIVDKTAACCLENGAKIATPLNVSGAFHSEFMREAAALLKEDLKEMELGKIMIPYVSNVTAEYVTEADKAKELMISQMYSPVKWQQSMERLYADGYEEFVEIGPGKTLAGFMKRINRKIKVKNISTTEDWESYLKLNIE